MEVIYGMQLDMIYSMPIDTIYGMQIDMIYSMQMDVIYSMQVDMIYSMVSVKVMLTMLHWLMISPAEQTDYLRFDLDSN